MIPEQPSNADFPIDWSDLGSETALMLMQFLNASFPMEETPDGSWSADWLTDEVREEQPENAALPIERNDAGSDKVLSVMHPAKEDSPMEVTESGISMVSSFEQPSNCPGRMADWLTESLRILTLLIADLLSPFGIGIEAGIESAVTGQFRNALTPTSVMVVGMTKSSTIPLAPRAVQLK